MDKERPKIKHPTGMLVMYGIVILIVVYMYYQVLQNYWAGGPDAPALSMVIISGVILLGGCCYIGYMAVRLYLQARRDAKKPDEDTEE